MSFHSRSFPAPLDDADAPTCTVWQVRLLLGRTDLSDKRFVAYVQALVDECGFPRPFPSIVKGQGVTKAVTPRSSFRRDAVLAWRDDYLPPDCSARITAQAMNAAALEMDAAAGNLRLVGGRAFDGNGA